MHLWCQTSLFFPHLSVVKSYRYGCRDLQHWKCCGEFLRRDVENCRHHSWNQHLTPAVAKPTAPVAKLISFAAAGAPCYPGAQAPWTGGHLWGRRPVGLLPPCSCPAQRDEASWPRGHTDRGVCPQVPPHLRNWVSDMGLQPVNASEAWSLLPPPPRNPPGPRRSHSSACP